MKKKIAKKLDILINIIVSVCVLTFMIMDIMAKPSSIFIYLTIFILLRWINRNK